MNTHIDTLAEWWSEAEHAPFRKGDMLISRREGEPVTYEVYPAGFDLTVPADNVRVLHRAPIPKPAWHDAPAVTATYRDDYGTVTGVWTPSGNHGYWIGPEDDVVMHDSLEDVTPLIEAKVTDEMIVRAANAWTGNGYQTTRDLSRDLREDITHALTAALGLETA